MRISIQPRDVDLADQIRESEAATNGSCCPTAQALIRLGYTEVFVGTNYATVKRGDWRGRFALPLPLTEQVESWDAGLGFKPGDFDLIPVKMPARDTVRR